MWATKPAFLFVLTIVLAVAVVGTEGFEKRWEDIHDGEKAGSGRTGLWKTALSVCARLDLDLQLTGVGYSGGLDTVENERGNRIHTHSDWFDNLLMFGVLGMAGWIALNMAMFKTIRSCASHSAEFAVGMAVFLVFLIESFFTGQMFGTYVMMFYIMAITSIVLSPQYELCGS